MLFLYCLASMEMEHLNKWRGRKRVGRMNIGGGGNGYAPWEGIEKTGIERPPPPHCQLHKTRDFICFVLWSLLGA